MVEHLVLFKLKPGTSDEQIDNMIERLRELADSIDSVVELSVGRNFSDRSQGHQVGLRVLFNDRQGLNEYLPHPAHLSCVNLHIMPILDLVTVVDYER